MPTGMVKFYNGAKGYDFIQRDNGRNDVFVHRRARAVGSARSRQRAEGFFRHWRSGKRTATNIRESYQPPSGAASDRIPL